MSDCPIVRGAKSGDRCDWSTVGLHFPICSE